MVGSFFVSTVVLLQSRPQGLVLPSLKVGHHIALGSICESNVTNLLATSLFQHAVHGGGNAVERLLPVRVSAAEDSVVDIQLVVRLQVLQPVVEVGSIITRLALIACSHDDHRLVGRQVLLGRVERGYTGRRKAMCRGVCCDAASSSRSLTELWLCVRPPRSFAATASHPWKH